MKLKAEGTISVSMAQSNEHGVIAPEAIQALLRPQTALVEVVHVSNVTGALNDVAAIGRVCRRAKVPFMVDASQSAGTVPVDVVGQCIDILAAPGHKGLLGPVGTGILYLAPALEVDTLFEGGTGSGSLEWDQPSESPERFESGTVNLPGIAGLLQGVRFLEHRGIDAVLRHKVGLVQRLFDGLSKLPGFVAYLPQRMEPTLLAFNVEGCDSIELADYLAQCDIAVRGGFHCSGSVHRKFGTLRTGMVRTSPGVFSTPEEIEACIEAVCRYRSAYRTSQGGNYVGIV
jgi:selenocysteine lyase/cysteine desulfurase